MHGIDQYLKVVVAKLESINIGCRHATEDRKRLERSRRSDLRHRSSPERQWFSITENRLREDEARHCLACPHVSDGSGLAEDAAEDRVDLAEVIVEVEFFLDLFGGQCGCDVGVGLEQFQQR